PAVMPPAPWDLRWGNEEAAIYFRVAIARCIGARFPLGDRLDLGDFFIGGAPLGGIPGIM
ncbi:MAG: hypothetical protein AAB368_09390, partial [bacterium]